MVEALLDLLPSKTPSLDILPKVINNHTEIKPLYSSQQTQYDPLLQDPSTLYPSFRARSWPVQR